MPLTYDDVPFPVAYSRGSSGGPEWSTDVEESDSGAERSNQNWSAPKRRYRLSGPWKPEDYALLLAHFNGRRGQARAFPFKDWTDYTTAADGISAPSATDQTLGSGTGALTQFQLKKLYADTANAYSRTIVKPVAASVLVALDGVLQTTGYSVSASTGIITFDSAPGSGVVVKAGCEFWTPARYATDLLDATRTAHRVMSATIDLREVRL